MSLSLGGLLSRGHREQVRDALPTTQLLGCVTLETALHLWALVSFPSNAVTGLEPPRFTVRLPAL